MEIRNSAKAIVLNNECILLNRCESSFGEYYALPGGGQLPGETLAETVKRELLEETGYIVTPLKLAGIYERITKAHDDGLNHKIYFIFLCSLKSSNNKAPTERDPYQLGMEWLKVRDIPEINLFPRAIRENISSLISFGETIFLGSESDI